MDFISNPNSGLINSPLEIYSPNGARISIRHLQHDEVTHRVVFDMLERRCSMVKQE